MASKVIKYRTKPDPYGEFKVYLRYQLKRGETQKEYKSKVAKAKEAIQKKHKIVGVGQQAIGSWYWIVKRVK